MSLPVEVQGRFRHADLEFQHKIVALQDDGSPGTVLDGPQYLLSTLIDRPREREIPNGVVVAVTSLNW